MDSNGFQKVLGHEYELLDSRLLVLSELLFIVVLYLNTNKGVITTKGGPDLDWRFVILRNYKVLDMRHVLVVGMNTQAGSNVGYRSE